MSKTAARIAKVGIVVVPVSDTDRAIEFYVDKLGLEKRADIPMGESYRWVEVAPPGAPEEGATIAISPPPPGQQAGNAQTGIILQTDDIESVHADLKAKGVDVDDEISRMGDPVPPLVWLRDPDANVLMIAEVAR